MKRKKKYNKKNWQFQGKSDETVLFNIFKKFEM